MKKKFKEIVLDQVGEKYLGQWTICFVHTPTESFCLKGWENNCTNYLKNIPTKIVHHYCVLGKSKKSLQYDFAKYEYSHVKLGSWLSLTSGDIYIPISRYPYSCYKNVKTDNSKHKYNFYCYEESKDGKYLPKILLTLKRIPNQWIPEYDEIIEEARKIREENESRIKTSNG